MLPGNQEGTVLIVALLMLIMLTVIGISASTISSIDIQIAGNDKFYKTAFYAADGGTEAGAQLLERNIDARAFTTSTVGSATIYNNDFWSQTQMPASNDASVTLSGNNVGLKIWGNSALSSGGAIQLVAGYEGKGKGAGGSGAYMVHEIRSEATTTAAARSTVRVKWRHMI
jgi:Tfp pilus assembly protein PilX